MSSIYLATRFKIGMYLFNSKLTDTIQVLNELPTDKIHVDIKVSQDRLLCPTHVDNKRKTGFW